jgi:hypothetical protein
MRRRGLRRFILELVFLAGVAAAVTVAELRPAGVIVVMAIAWIVVALLEWTAWLDEPHYGRGLPPRYYVPQVALPPPRAVDQGRVRYPVAPPPVRRPEPDVDDAPTFERPATEWDAEIGQWPDLDTSASEETMIASPDSVEADAPSAIVPLPPVLGVEETVEHRFDLEEEPAPPPVADPEPEGIDPLVVAAALATPLIVDPHVSLPEPAVPEPEPEMAPSAVPEPEPRGGRAPLPTPVRMDAPTLHRIDPLASSGRRRFLIFRGGGEEITVVVEDGPPPDRVLPASVLEQAKAARR